MSDGQQVLQIAVLLLAPNEPENLRIFAGRRMVWISLLIQTIWMLMLEEYYEKIRKFSRMTGFASLSGVI